MLRAVFALSDSIHPQDRDPFHAEIPPLDLDTNETEVLRRYHTMFTILKSSGMCLLPERPLIKEDIGKSIQDTAIRHAVCHATQGSTYIEEVQGNTNYLVLQAALILTITMPQYIAPPDLKSTALAHSFSACIGIAAFGHLMVIIGATIFTALLNRPYTTSDTLLLRIEFSALLTSCQYLNYIANILFIVAALVVGFDRSLLDGGIPCILVVFGTMYLMSIWVKTRIVSTINQDTRVFLFYKKYCSHGEEGLPWDGTLAPQYLKLVNQKESDSE